MEKLRKASDLNNLPTHVTDRNFPDEGVTPTSPACEGAPALGTDFSQAQWEDTTLSWVYKQLACVNKEVTEPQRVT